MSDHKKFDVVIGNPPYQEEAQGASTRAEPIYPLFMDAAYEVADLAVLVTPARFLSNSGQTKSAWNRKMLADPHLKVADYVPDSSELFPGTDIKGGIVVTYRDATAVIGPIGTFLGAMAKSMSGILTKVESTNRESLSTLVSSRALYRFSDLAADDHVEIRRSLGSGSGNQITPPSLGVLSNVVFFDDEPADEHEYIRLIGVIKGARERRWIRRDYVNKTASLDRWKVVIAQANNSGAFGETLSSPLVAEPGLGHTDTFLSVGSFDTAAEAEACLQYLKTKFARALLSVLKTTQHNPKGKWKHVPLQDFTTGSDIDWTKTVIEIDRQLYAKYGLDVDEIAFIEGKVKPMV